MDSRQAIPSALFYMILMGLCLPLSSARGDSLNEWVNDSVDELITIYQDFHAHPEVSFEEENTANRLATHLKATGAEVQQNIGGHGVVALIKNGNGPTLMLRTDLDGLPVTEETGLIFASKETVTAESGSQSGVMHACGHDVHMTNLIGTAQYLASHKEQWKGTLMLIGQPAEEKGAGAKAMLTDGLFEKFPKPDFAIALHVDPYLPTGRVGYRSGYAMANVDSVDITLQGKGGHGAYPHTTIDPVIQAAQLVMSLQTIVSREIKPIEPAVITVGSIHGGTKHNIIGNSCHLQLTVRSYSEEVRKHLLEAIVRKSKAVAIGAAAEEPIIDISEGTPSLFNDEELSARIVPVFEKLLGKENAVASEPSMGGEDFSRYGRSGVPILMYRLGSVEAKRLNRYKELGQKPPSLHSSLYYPDIEPTLKTGLKTMIGASLNILALEN
ncbi:MAG: M20 metallopeptidase family protein [Pirellulales bacterium]